MALKRRRLTREFKLQVLHELEAGKSLAQVAREHEVLPATICRWRAEARKYAEQAFAGNGHLYKDQARLGELERKVGQMTMENDLLKKALLRLEGLGRGKSADANVKRSTN